MTRLAMPDHACKSVDVPTAHGPVRYQPDRSGSVEVDNPQHVKWLRQGADCFIASGHSIPHAPGYPCACGHGSLFRRCGKCGALNEKG